MQIILIRHGEKQPDSLPEEVHQLTATGQRAKRERDSIASSSSDESNAIERFVRILADVDVRAGDELGSESVLTGDQRRRFEEWSGDLLSPLSRQGQDDLDDLAKMLERRSIRPDVFLTSAAEHARQSASILTGRLLPAQSPVALPLRGMCAASRDDVIPITDRRGSRELTPGSPGSLGSESGRGQ
jgi:phosphohistidine phosphatase SixA